MARPATLATAEAVAEHLTASGKWHRKGGPGYLIDDYGSELYLADTGDSLVVNVCYYALGSNLVETLDLDTDSSVARIARIITAATAPEDD